MLKRTVFFWLTSFGAATVGYYLLWLVLPEHRVSGATYRMLFYHDAHPLAFIALACLCYGLLAAGAARAFSRRGQSGRVMITLTVNILTTGISLPLGGMLWYWYDMRAGCFPAHWGRILLEQGSLDGWAVGWLVMLLSVPCSWLGLPICYYLLQTGNRLFPPRPLTPFPSPVAAEPGAS